MTIPQLSFVCLCLISFCIPLKAERLVVPPGAVGQEGDQSIGLLSFRSDILLRYAPSQFIIPVNTFMMVESVSFRLDRTVDYAIDKSLPRFQLDFSTSSSAFTRNFRANHGPDQMTAYDGPIRFVVPASPPGTKPFNITIPLTTPFYYNPAAGDLVLEMRNYQQVFGTSMDFDYLGTPLIKSVISHDTPGAFFGDEAYSGAGMPMEITYSLVQVPEPKLATFLAVGIVLIFAFRCSK